jgi:dTDP-4-dehydrorhamnose 3,5-epimerase
MEITKTRFEGLLIIKPAIYRDQRGYFFESYNQNTFRDHGIDITFLQDNQSRSSFGTIRGLHYQLNPFAQTKLLRVLEGKILDVSVDLRKNSSTFHEYLSVELSEENQMQILIPRGFAHGFSVLSRTATILYKCDNLYHPEAERGIYYADPGLKIDWHLSDPEIIISAKDAGFPRLGDAEMNF